VPERLAYQAYTWIWLGLDWLLPPICGGCGKPGARWCEHCQQETIQITPPVCDVCGKSQIHAGICASCKRERPVYTALRTWAAFQGPLRNAIHRLKYYRDIALGDSLARAMMKCLAETGWTIELVVPVPMSPERASARGYNQAAQLARPIALYFGYPYLPQAVRKIRNTSSQVGLTLEQRRKNVAGAFAAQAELVSGKVVLVVDDVATSGATLNACAQTLKEAGAREVYCLTLARAL
jgi:ComF family protein